MPNGRGLFNSENVFEIYSLKKDASHSGNFVKQRNRKNYNFLFHKVLKARSVTNRIQTWEIHSADAALVFSFQNRDRLHGGKIPDMGRRITANLSSGYQITCRMDAQTKDVISVLEVELLWVALSVVYNANSGNMVDYVAVLSIEEVVTAVISSIPKKQD